MLQSCNPKRLMSTPSHSSSPGSGLSSQQLSSSTTLTSVSPSEFCGLVSTNDAAKRQREQCTNRIALKKPHLVRELAADTERSPWVPTARKALDIDNINLSESYERYQKPPQDSSRQRKPKRQKRWTHEGNGPLLDISSLPTDWNAREPDLHPMDIEGQIKRCKERIEDNIMTFVFEHRLRAYERRKLSFERLRDSEEPGLSWEVLQRMKCLRKVESFLQEDDPDKQLPNVKAILSAYRNETLDWNKLVTYWSKGKQLCQPRPFDWDEFEVVNANHGIDKGFWVEGFHGPGSALNHARMLFPRSRNPNYAHMVFYRIALRFPGSQWWCELSFLYDTGSTYMEVYAEDLPLITGPGDWRVPTLGTTTITTGYGVYISRAIQLEATILDERGRRMSPWVRIVAAVRPDSYHNTSEADHEDTIRADGHMMRNIFYYATVPDGREWLYVANKKRSLDLPNIPLGRSWDTGIDRDVSALGREYYGPDGSIPSMISSEPAREDWTSPSLRPLPKPSKGIPKSDNSEP